MLEKKLNFFKQVEKMHNDENFLSFYLFLLLLSYGKITNQFDKGFYQLIEKTLLGQNWIVMLLCNIRV